MAISIGTSDILIKAEKYVKHYLDQWLSKTRYFHGAAHTCQVVAGCGNIAAFYDIPPADAEALVLAAWFHDVGYCHDSKGHEQISITILSQFLFDYPLPKQFIAQAEQLIRATEINYNPDSLLEKIIRDADSSHLGSPDYVMWSKKLMDEMVISDGQTITALDWTKRNIDFFKKHHFYTDYALNTWQSQKDANLKQLIKLVS